MVEIKAFSRNGHSRGKGLTGEQSLWEMQLGPDRRGDPRLRLWDPTQPRAGRSLPSPTGATPARGQRS